MGSLHASLLAIQQSNEANEVSHKEAHHYGTYHDTVMVFGIFQMRLPVFKAETCPLLVDLADLNEQAGLAFGFGYFIGRLRLRWWSADKNAPGVDNRVNSVMLSPT